MEGLLTVASASPAAPRTSTKGFTLVEALASLAVMVLISGGVLALATATNRIADTQFAQADLQQTARAAWSDMIRHLRMLGRGGLPATDAVHTWPDGLAVGVRTDVQPNTGLFPGAPDRGPDVLPYTDVLTVRGVFETPIYQINHSDRTTFTLVGNEGTLTVSATTPTAIPQDLDPLIDRIGRSASGTTQEALMLVGPADDRRYAVVRLDPARSTAAADGSSVQLHFVIAGDELADAYAGLAPGGVFPTEMTQTRVAYLGVLEEYRYYVRDERTIPGDLSTPPLPRLSRARTYPGTTRAFADDPTNLQVDLADGVMDLQVALGFDSDRAGSWDDDVGFDGDDDRIYESSNGVQDDWLFNSPDDDATQAPWSGADPARLYYVRINTLTRALRRSRGDQSREIDRIEDRDYAQDPANEPEARLYRRLLLRTAVDMRNLG